MSSFDFYDLATGLFIGQSFMGDLDHIQHTMPTGLGYAKGVADWQSQRVDLKTGVVVDYQPPGPPADTQQTWAWDDRTRRWIATPTLAAHKADKWEQMKQARSAAIDAPLATPHGTFDSYAQARADIADSVLLAQTLASIGQPVAIAYTLADNTVVTLDLAKMVTVGLMLGAKVQTARAIATTLRAAIDAALDIATVETIKWPAT